MNPLYNTFTLEQKGTYEKVTKIKDRMAEIIDPAYFVLNNELQSLRKELAQLQNDCNHVWDGKICIVCGKYKEEEE